MNHIIRAAEQILVFFQNQKEYEPKTGHMMKMQNAQYLARLKEGFCIQFFVLRQCPRTSLQCFAIGHSLSKVKHCRDVLGQKTRYKIGP